MPGDSSSRGVVASVDGTMALPRVLLVDDSPVVRLLAARRLRAAGLEVEERASFAEAAAGIPPGLACALLDFDLGDGRGSDLVPLLGDVPFAFFTSDEDTTALRELGRVFRKPDELDAAVAWAGSFDV